MKAIFFVLGLIIAIGCDKENNSLPLNADATGWYNFDDGLQGWEAGVSDFPLNAEDSVMFESGIATVPTDSLISAMRLAGNDVNQDLFMFITQKLGPVEPETSYDLIFTFNIMAENLEEVEVSGSDIFIFPKIGATTVKPEVSATSDTIRLGYLGQAINIDKGAGNLDGSDMMALGALQLPFGPGETTIPNLISNSVNVFRATTDSNGDLWIIVGIESAESLVLPNWRIRLILVLLVHVGLSGC